MTIYMVYNIVMLKVNIAEAKSRLSEYLRRSEAGETIFLARRNIPVAELRPLRRPVREARPFGLCGNEFRVPPDFDRPVPASAYADGDTV